MGLISEFKEFALKGNVVDMAIGVIIGAAFKDIVTSFTDSFINPLIASVGGAEIAGAQIVILDDKGKVVQMVIDVAQNKPAWTIKGEFVNAESYPSKRQKGDNYNMAKFGQSQDRNGDGKVLEWYEQAAAFNTYLEGNTKENFWGSGLQKNCEADIFEFDGKIWKKL